MQVETFSNYITHNIIVKSLQELMTEVDALNWDGVVNIKRFKSNRDYINIFGSTSTSLCCAESINGVVFIRKNPKNIRDVKNILLAY